jgi:hypothetical protein
VATVQLTASRASLAAQEFEAFSSRALGGQEHELRYESNKSGKPAAAVKKAVKSEGNSRKVVESSWISDPPVLVRRSTPTYRRAGDHDANSGPGDAALVIGPAHTARRPNDAHARSKRPN